MVLELYTADDIAESIAPVAFMLCGDSVASVRLSAFRVIAGVLHKFTQVGDKQMPVTFVNDVVGRFAHNSKWCNRQ